MTETALDEGIVGLYAGPLETFVARRDALVKELRAKGEREAAANIKNLRKPSRTAWALDLGVLGTPHAMHVLDTALSETLAAHSGSGDVRAAMTGLRNAMRDLAAHAARAAEREGLPVDAAVLATALQSVLGAQESLQQLRRGCLAEVPESDGLDFLATLPAPPMRAPPAPQKLEEAKEKPAAPKIRPLATADRAEWMRLLSLLYPDSVAADHAPSVDAYLAGRQIGELIPSAVFVVARTDGRLGGFLELSVRNYAEGCTGDTPYIESWFVDEDLRTSGTGRLLMDAAEHWAREHGYSELASDALLDNVNSHAAHRALGFEEVERAVHFRKALRD